MVQNNDKTKSPTTTDFESFFDELVGNLRYDEQMLRIGTLDEEKVNFYEAAVLGNQEFIFKQMKQGSSIYFISKMMPYYLNELIKSGSFPKKLALEMSDNRILVWAEIKENDEAMENALILSESKTNAKFSEFGFSISSTIVEDCDNLKIPSHYKEIPITPHA